MRKTFLITAILLLSAAWAVAQTSPSTPQSTTPDASSQQSTSPSSTSPSQQPATPDTSSTTTQTTTTQSTQTSSSSSTSIEGCLSGSAGNWTLTDQSGKTWQLAGDTSKLSDHVGHQVRLMGTDNSSSASGSSSPSSSNPSSSTPGSSAGATGAGSSAQSTFTVNKVKMISSTCSTSK
jgi:trimeric autotransporter adhesin